MSIITRLQCILKLQFIHKVNGNGKESLKRLLLRTMLTFQWCNSGTSIIFLMIYAAFDLWPLTLQINCSFYIWHSQIHRRETAILPCDMKVWAAHASITADADASSTQQLVVTQTTFLHSTQHRRADPQASLSIRCRHNLTFSCECIQRVEKDCFQWLF